MIGQKIGPYEVTAKLGEGGMGEVYRATDTKLKRDVAIKVLPAAFTEDKERLARFEREAQLLAQLQHPHIASIYGLEESGATRALVMELVEGPTLADRLSHGALVVEEALATARQIAEALEAAHEKGIVHRDLKPQNVKVPLDGTVKVLDFGLAKAMDSPSAAADLSRSPTLMNSPTLTAAGTQLGMILGTAAYMAPEQARGGAVDKRADIWAFGVVLYEMLAGRSLFAGKTVTDTLAGVLKTEIDFAKLPHETPASIRALLRRCLERNPKNRLHDIADARLVLADVLAGRSGESEPTASSAESSRRRAVPWVIAAALAVALAAVGARDWLGGEPEGPRFTFEQKTFRSETIYTARFASDGKTIVYSASQQGTEPRLYVIRPEYPEPQPLGLDRTHLLAISSRDELAVLSHARWVNHRNFEGTLGRVSVGAGAPRDLVEKVRDADWTPDGSELAIVRDVGGRDRLELPIGHTVYESSGYLSDIQVSPDGGRVAFLEHPVRFDDRGAISVVDRAGKHTVLASGYWGEEGLAWQPGGEALSFAAAKQGGVYQMLTVDLEGRESLLAPTPGSVTLQDVSANGELLFTQDDRSLQVVARPPGETAVRDFSWLNYSLGPLLARDGRLLALTDEGPTGGVNYTALLRRTDGSQFVRLGEGTAMAISPNGRWLVVFVPSSPSELMLYPTGPGEARRIDRGELESYREADWFSDGKRLLVTGNEPGKPSRCYAISLEGGRPRPVTPEGTSVCRISPDGGRAIAQDQSGRYKLFRLDGEDVRDFPAVGSDEYVSRWSPDGEALWVYSFRELPTRVFSIEIESGRRTLLESIELGDAKGVVSVQSVSLADDPSVYATDILRHVSKLFVAEKRR